MDNLIGLAITIATLFGGTYAAREIYQEVRVAALSKAAQGLPKLPPFATTLMREPRPIEHQKNDNHPKKDRHL